MKITWRAGAFLFFCVLQASGGKHEASAERESRAMGGARVTRDGRDSKHLVFASARMKKANKNK